MSNSSIKRLISSAVVGFAVLLGALQPAQACDATFKFTNQTGSPVTALTITFNSLALLTGMSVEPLPDAVAFLVTPGAGRANPFPLSEGLIPANGSVILEVKLPGTICHVRKWFWDDQKTNSGCSARRGCQQLN